MRFSSSRQTAPCILLGLCGSMASRSSHYCHLQLPVLHIVRHTLRFLLLWGLMASKALHCCELHQVEWTDPLPSPITSLLMHVLVRSLILWCLPLDQINLAFDVPWQCCLDVLICFGICFFLFLPFMFTSDVITTVLYYCQSVTTFFSYTAESHQAIFFTQKFLLWARHTQKNEWSI